MQAYCFIIHARSRSVQTKRLYLIPVPTSPPSEFAQGRKVLSFLSVECGNQMWSHIGFRTSAPLPSACGTHETAKRSTRHYQGVVRALDTIRVLYLLMIVVIILLLKRTMWPCHWPVGLGAWMIGLSSSDVFCTLETPLSWSQLSQVLDGIS